LGWEDARVDREHEIAPNGLDQRGAFQRDRDRLLYSSGFHRLAGITQIVRAGEADFFHTRQQHTMKVAQVGRRLAEWVIDQQKTVSSLHGVHPEVVEAACLAHDMGHPPFGHIGEYTLNDAVNAVDPGAGGYEGNAQSFRLITKLGVRFDDVDGLDLTRATLAAVLKYPWFRTPGVSGKDKKWSAYESEKQAFVFAREFHPHEEQTAEAALMDWADDIAYSVHDLEDFHRAGAIPWYAIFDRANEADLVARAKAKWYDGPTNAEAQVRTALRGLRDNFENALGNLAEPYNGSREHRQVLRTLTSTLIGRYVRATKLAETAVGKPLIIADQARAEVLILKQITQQYVISSPILAAQQIGQRRVIMSLFDHFVDNKYGDFPPYLPIRLRYLWPLAAGCRARFAADCVASLTEHQAMALYARLHGTAAGSVLDPIVR
jgi:dGTPase